MESVNLLNKLNRREYNNLDHVYCHTNESGYVRSKNSNDVDMVSVLKEIKQLKACINLHLDLIQDQSDQLISKDKMLMILKKENDSLKGKIEKLEKRSKSNGKTDESPIVDQIITELPEINSNQDVLKKLSSTLLTNCTIKLNALSNSIEEVLDIDQPTTTADIEIDSRSLNVVTNTSQNNNDAFAVSDITTTNNNNKKSSNNESIIGTLDGKPISKIVLQRVVVATDNNDATIVKTEKSEKSVKIKSEKFSPPHHLQSELSNVVSEKSITSQLSKDANNSECVPAKLETVRKSRKNGKKEKSADEGTAKRRRDDKAKSNKKSAVIVEAPLQPVPQTSRNSVMTTTEMYRTREWQMDEIEVLVNRQISDCGDEALQGDEINLEVPRWRIRETTNGVYSSEGTEDLSDDVFLKRHARLEHAEKKRKKWDFQRIREQRTIERLKRRHCKNEIVSNDQNVDSITSFYPSPENVKYVQVAEELPVVAFGEPIHVPLPSEFTLPWNHQYRDKSISIIQTATILNADHTTIQFRPKKKPARRTAPSQPPTSRSTRRVRR